MNTKDQLPEYYLYIPLLIAMSLYMVGIMRTDLWTPDEPRYAEVAREMIERGNYIQPYLNYGPYTEKPPLFFWMVVAGAKLFGDVNQLAVRLPSVLSALGTLALLIAFMSEHFDRKKAFLAAIILCISPEFFWLARCGRIDMLLTFLITASLVSFYKWYVKERCAYLISFYLCIALATLAKGPIGMLLPLMVVVFFLAFRKEWNKINRMRLYYGVPIAIGIVLAWYIPATQQSAGYDFGPMAKRQIIGRVLHPTSHAVSISYWPFYHFKALATGMFPWLFLIPPAIVVAYQSRRNSPLFFLLCWASVVFVFFTIIAAKRDLYILPMYPATAALIALWVLRATPSFNMKLVRVMSACMGIFLLVIVVIAPAYLNRKFHDLYFHHDLKIIIPLTIAGIIAMATAIFGKKLDHIIGMLIGSVLIFLMTIITIILPQMNEFKSPRSICNVYNYAKDPDSEIAMMWGARSEYVFYTKSHLKVVQDRDGLKKFFNSRKKMFCFIKAKDYERMLKIPDFQIFVVAKERVSSRVMMLLCNKDLSSPTFN